MRDQLFNDIVAIGAAAVVIVASIAAVTVWNNPTDPPPGANATRSYLNISIDLNAHYGVPQFSPANFTLPEGVAIITITDNDLVNAFSACACQVTGTVGGTETINGSAVTSVSPANVAHTFDVPVLGINVLSPGGGVVVTFELNLDQTGTFTWLCEVPCGGGPNGYGFPMFTTGFMEGALTVV